MERVIVLPDAALTARAAGLRLLLALIDAQSVTAPVHVALTGGTLGTRMLRSVAGEEVAGAVDWSQVHLWWGDERFAEDSERNASQVRDWLESLPIPRENVHEVARPGEVGDVEAAAEAYAQAVRDVHFAVVILGVGPDGHVASLFPGRDEVNLGGRGAVAVHDSPKPPPMRVSLTRESLCDADEVWFVAAGAEKAPMVAASVLPGEDPVPAARVRGTTTIWLLDTAAAGAL
ncbi:MAG: 6-phosphogluconolactonase [Actinomycetota bacterium]